MMKFHLTTKAILIAILVLLIGNLVYLDYISLSSQYPKEGGDFLQKSDYLQNRKENRVLDSCYPYSCVDLIKLATASISLKSVQNPTVAVSSVPREYYIPLGSGETSKEQYEDVSGLQAYVDTTKYGNIQKVTFEASLRIPTANGKLYVQLYDATDNHPVWYSEVSSEGNASKMVISTPVTLEKGNKLYKVQAKTTLKYQSIIDLARIHIITDE